MSSLFLYAFLLFCLLYCTQASTLVLRQYQDSSYTTCAQGCFEPLVNATGCPFDVSGTRNACLCSSVSFLTNFMTCTFQKCGGEVLAQTAETAVTNCETTNTPSALNQSQLVSVGQGTSTSGTASLPSSTVSSTSLSTSLSTQTASSNPSPTPSITSTTTSSSTTSTTTSSTFSISTMSTNTASGTTSTPTTSPTASNAPSNPLSSGGLDAGAIIGIVFGIIGTIGVVAAIIFGLRQWNTRDPGDRAIRDVGSWFCGIGRNHHRDEVPMRPYPYHNPYP